MTEIQFSFCTFSEGDLKPVHFEFVLVRLPEVGEDWMVDEGNDFTKSKHGEKRDGEGGEEGDKKGGSIKR